MREAGFLGMLVGTVCELVWNFVHPRPLASRWAAVFAVGLAGLQCFHIPLVFGLLPLTNSVTLTAVVVVSVQLCAMLVSQVGTAFVIVSGRSPVQYKVLAMIVATLIGTLVTSGPLWAREASFVVTVVTFPLLLLAFTMSVAARTSQVVAGDVVKEENGLPDDGLFDVNFPTALIFLCFSSNALLGDALNDMGTELKVRETLMAGDTSVSLTHSVAVLVSMCCAFVMGSAFQGQRQELFIVLWAFAQLIRGVGLEYVSLERAWLMAVFVFLDRLVGPVGEAAMDVALLGLLQGGREKSWPSLPRIPATGAWVFKSTVERLQRPLCGMALMRLQRSSAPVFVPPACAFVAAAFVVHLFHRGRRDAVESDVKYSRTDRKEKEAPHPRQPHRTANTARVRNVAHTCAHESQAKEEMDEGREVSQVQICEQHELAEDLDQLKCAVEELELPPEKSVSLEWVRLKLVGSRFTADPQIHA